MDPTNPFFPFVASNPGDPYAALYNVHAQAVANQNQQAQQANIAPHWHINQQALSQQQAYGITPQLRNETAYFESIKKILIAASGATHLDPRDEAMKMWDDDFERVKNGSN